ncbi:restriction modification system DNA specificity domain-containing protein [Anoxybacillus ayderensis]|uniref:restriction endonuclease subunit S n=1 Tax=Anoxybacillus ayderensis TaxID=265546 RepID=UPI000385CB7A|nr:restriction endonuclease subunit S [Anoxybacillus ayderensis]EPZ38561.1 restriction modification system DNA specificity domain-containing protein [Anoxybacillus ayderensis]
MSKAKQKSIDELLKEALVPEDEQPYEVPGNWVWVRLKSVNKNEKRNIDPRDYGEEIFELYSVPSYDLDEPEYIKGKEIGSNKQLVQENEILLCKINPRINRVWIVSNSKGKYRQLASTEWIVVSNSQVIYPKYLLFLLKSPYFRKLITSNVSGVGGSLTRAKPKDVEMYPIAVPPLNEQKRIVDKIERLFAKIDEAKRLIEEVKGAVELRRAAILDRAFRGELETNDPFEAPNQINEKEIVPPNEQPYQVPENWVWVKLKSCLKNLQYGYTASSSVSEEGPKYLRITDIQNGHVDWEKVPHCKIDEEQLEKYRLNKGDIVIARTGATTGKSFLIDDVPCAVFASYLIRLTINDYLDARYLWNYLKSPMYWKQITVVQKGIAQPGANAQIIGGLSLPLPPVREQQRIAEKVDFLLNKLDSEKQLALEIEQKIDLIKQSILSKAFSGELGTNDPNDEHAIELLKEVLLQTSGQS